MTSEPVVAPVYVAPDGVPSATGTQAPPSSYIHCRVGPYPPVIDAARVVPEPSHKETSTGLEVMLNGTVPIVHPTGFGTTACPSNFLNDQLTI